MEAKNDSGQAFAQWLSSLTVMTGTQHAAKAWREHRYRFAHRLGDALAGATHTAEAVSGPVIYGIWLEWGCLYVGQTTDASRRLRDLPVGESHHVATTFPPETWDRIIVVTWPALPEANNLRADLDQKTIGLALEYKLQVRLNPLVNSWQRTRDGGWRAVEWQRSMSLGARSAAAIGSLADQVDALFDLAVNHEVGCTALPDSVRCVRPKQFLTDKSALNSTPGGRY
ncbi:hypothetical protein MYCO108962_17715 [Mycobacterium colombiense]|uniref:hypothetical protein n=1 Tax=Mycobacterium colombiense TaxID=339268 RepID=UPI0011E4CA34|nr:hypothetical protein [Mycobacterium colombiense]